MLILAEETMAFNLGLRDTIFIKISELKNVVRAHFSTSVIGRGCILVVSKLEQLSEFFNLSREYGEDYALGIILGYPPKCVDWFVNSTMEEHRTCKGVHGGSFSFKCPKELFSSAKDYMELHHNVELHYDVPVEGILVIRNDLFLKNNT